MQNSIVIDLWRFEPSRQNGRYTNIYVYTYTRINMVKFNMEKIHFNWFETVVLKPFVFWVELNLNQLAMEPITDVSTFLDIINLQWRYFNQHHLYIFNKKLLSAYTIGV